MAQFTLGEHVNNVFAEFGSVIPENWLSWEDVARKFVRVRALELEKMGLSNTGKTLQVNTWVPTAREGAVESKFVSQADRTSIHPQHVELQANSVSNYRDYVEIVPVAAIPEFEGDYAVAFYGDPLQYKMSADLWEIGTIYVYYDTIESWDDYEIVTTVDFPPNFTVMLELKTAIAVADLALLKIAVKNPKEISDMQREQISKAMGLFIGQKSRELREWEDQFKVWLNRDRNTQPRVRRTYDELQWRDYRQGRRNRFYN